MNDTNVVILTGRLTRDLELKYTTGGTAIGEFGLAVNNFYKPKDQEEFTKETTFVDVTTWGPRAERLSDLKKGSRVVVEARLKLDQWTNKETGEPRKKLVLVGNKVTALDFKVDAEEEESDVPFSVTS